MTSPLPRVIGHRGAATHAPENTLAGLSRAAELGAPWVEFDVRLTADKVAILHHDDTLKRTAGRNAAAASLTTRRSRSSTPEPGTATLSTESGCQPSPRR